jgi:hypothetical protein
MPTYKTVIEFTDVREILIEARDIEAARKKYDAGDWASQDTIDFFSAGEQVPLHQIDGDQ